MGKVRTHTLTLRFEHANLFCLLTIIEQMTNVARGIGAKFLRLSCDKGNVRE